MHTIGCLVIYGVIILALILNYVIDKQPFNWYNGSALAAAVIGLGWTLYNSDFFK